MAAYNLAREIQLAWHGVYNNQPDQVSEAIKKVKAGVDAGYHPTEEDILEAEDFIWERRQQSCNRGQKRATWFASMLFRMGVRQINTRADLAKAILGDTLRGILARVTK